MLKDINRNIIYSSTPERKYERYLVLFRTSLLNSDDEPSHLHVIYLFYLSVSVTFSLPVRGLYDVSLFLCQR